jgi:hypothetical protein
MEESGSGISGNIMEFGFGNREKQGKPSGKPIIETRFEATVFTI